MTVSANTRALRITERVERLRALDGELHTTTPPLPHSAKIELTSRCNYACGFCASHLRGGPRRDMPWALYTRLARELREDGVEQLGLFYIGESLLYPRLEEAVRFAKHACGYPYVFLTTNGSLATGERARNLMRAGLDSLKFALNFANGAQLAQGAGAPEDTWVSVVENLIAACDARDAHERATGRRCMVSASSLRYCEIQPGLMAPALERLAGRLDQHYWLPPFGAPQTWQSCVPPERRGVSPPLARKELPCWPLYTEAHVTADGWLSACSLDHSPRFRVADLGACPFAQAWHAPPFQALRRAHLAGDVSATPCAHCVGYGHTDNDNADFHRSTS